MIASSKFNDVLTEIGQMTLDEQTELVGILQRRLIDLRRDQILAEIKESTKEFNEGKAVVTNIDDLMRELEQ